MPPAPPPPNVALATKAAPTKAAPTKSKITFKRGIETPRGTAVVINAVEGWGKTTVAAHSKKPLMLLIRNELGYLKLLEHKRVPEVDYIIVDSWTETLDVLDHLNSTDTDHETLCIDALSNLEKLCHEHVCRRDFNNDWTETGFLSWNKGYTLAVNDWLQLIAKLERLQSNRSMNIILLSHVQTKPYKNPVGEDYDRFVPNVHEKTWEPTKQWPDAVLLGNFYTTTTDAKGGKKAKGIGGTDRIIYTERRAAWDAKNRMNMPESIDIPNDPARAWSTIAQHMEAK